MQPSTPTDLVARVGAHVRQDRLLAGVDRLLVACSAGSDSTALLEVMVRIAPDHGVDLGVAHTGSIQQPQEQA